MPVAAHFDPDSHFVMFRCSGNVAISEARRAFDQMVTDPAVFPDAHTLWDLRGATLAEKPRAIPDLLDMLHTRHPDRIAGKRVAILVAEEHGAGVTSIVENATHPDTPTVRVFLNYARAASWLAGQDI
jgi:hypothetical protein